MFNFCFLLVLSISLVAGAVGQQRQFISLDYLFKHSYPRPLSSVECLSNTFNCPAGYSCQYEQCWPVDSGRACVVEGECSQRFYKCIYGRCQAFQDDKRTECTNTQQCPKYHMCRLGQCWPSTIKDHPCTCDYSCPNSHIYRCTLGACKIPGSGKSYGLCSRNSDCPSDHICNSKICYPREQNLCRCNYDGQCNDSHLYECSNGTCQLQGNLLNSYRK